MFAIKDERDYMKNIEWEMCIPHSIEDSLTLYDYMALINKYNNQGFPYIERERCLLHIKEYSILTS